MTIILVGACAMLVAVGTSAWLEDHRSTKHKPLRWWRIKRRD